MTRKRLVVLMLGFALQAVAATASGPIVTVTGGQVKGFPVSSGAAFKGIPFAAPPIGELRWKEPAPVRPWSGIRDALAGAAPCVQADQGYNKVFVDKASEDCLYLNVWTPEWPVKTLRPVMFWIHGGSNLSGYGAEPIFDGARLAAHGVVVVTANYRLGPFGFLAHPELTAGSPHHASGNYALLDQLAALKWVNANIAKFGGDPSRVTVFGQSAGASNIGLLLTSPLAKGLIHRAIEESGTVLPRGLPTPLLRQAEESGVRFAASLKAPAAHQIQFLRGLSTAGILAAPRGGQSASAPCVDGYVAPQSPAVVFRNHEELPVPLIIGSNAREGSLPGGEEALKKALESFYGPRAPEALKLYAASDGYAPHGDGNAQWYTDGLRCASGVIADWHGEKFPAWRYEFSDGPEPKGAFHSWEIQFVFGTMLMGIERPANLTDPMMVAYWNNPTVIANQPGDRKLSDQVMSYWTNFARTGDPNGGTLAKWPGNKAGESAYLDFAADGAVARRGLRKEACEMYGAALIEKLARQ